jgi:hypothetical protein
VDHPELATQFDCQITDRGLTKAAAA